jgi:RNA polymerase sigma factor (sigma-70 family)
MRDDPMVIDLVTRAQAGDASAWDAIVDRYAALVWSLCRRYGLQGTDADDVAGTVWLRLVERLDTLREPAALPGWLARTTVNECLNLLRTRRRQIPVDDPELGDSPVGGTEEGLLVEERHHALRLALAELPERCRRLLTLLFAEPPPSYEEIGARLDLPIGAIGPNRGRCLERLRRNRALVALRPDLDPASGGAGA